jgi:sarcosine oxidase, subunit gamma
MPKENDSVVERLSTSALVRSLSVWPLSVGPDCAIRTEQHLGIAKMRVAATDAAATFRRFAGIAPPPTGRQLDHDGATFAWMGPSEWLLTGADDVVRNWLARIDHLGGDDVLAADMSHARVSFVVEGPAVRDVITAHCPLDLGPRSFPVGAVARSLLANAGVFIARLADAEGGARFRLVVDQTMAAHVARMLSGPRSRSGERA